jgi:inosine-uridine nucleoside N-ribohydrolase
MTGSLWVDADPGLGLFLADVDDALALAHLAAWDVPVAGLSTCYGNASLPRVTRVARDLSERLGLGPVASGAHHPADTDTEAVDALLAHRGTVLALAPLTNIAAALERGARWEGLIVLGGTDRRLPNLRPWHTTELNLAVDERAARVALSACTTLFPMEICRTVSMDATHLASAPRWLRDGCAAWLRSSPVRTGRPAFHPWDLLPAVWITHPELFGLQPSRVTLASRPGWRGSVRFDRGRLPVARTVRRRAFWHTWEESCRRLRDR